MTANEGREVRLAVVGGAAAFHGRAFSTLINGYDAEALQAAGWWKPQHRLTGARVVKVWDPDRSAAEQLARVTGIAHVVDRMEECAEDVDGILIPDDMSMKHQTRARFFLEQRLPTFVDKPLSPDPEEATAIVAFAETMGAPLMTGSALRYARELEEVCAEMEALGELRAAWAIGPGDLVFYGIHVLEMLHTLFGPGIRTVQNIGREGKETIQVEFQSGIQATMAVHQGIAYVFGLALYGTKGWRVLQISDSSYFYWNLLQHFATMVRTGQPPIPPSHAVEIIQGLNLALRSRQADGARLAR